MTIFAFYTTTKQEATQIEMKKETKRGGGGGRGERRITSRKLGGGLWGYHLKDYQS